MFACVGTCARTYAQQYGLDTIRYVRTSGTYNNDGKSWANAKNSVQDAINDLRDYLAANNLTSGSVYIASGTYVPTESTENIGGSMLNTSFKIYAGIHVYGGFNEADPESRPGDRLMSNNKKCSENWADLSGIGTTDGSEIVSQWDLKYKTILSGNHTTTEPTFVFDAVRGRYNTTFPASSFHVVWFATNGMFETANDSISGHYKPLEHPASLNGCVISAGNASSRNTTFREHAGYGGGVYMVANSEIRNCTIERCNANLGGGGVYMDGGGVMEFCYVHTCQSPGVGVYEGYGGGVLVEYDGQVGHSHITSCASRCGGGLAITHTPGEYPWQQRVEEHILSSDTEQISQYSPFATACVINNNTASAEAGAIYLADGGTINHCTVTANNNIGPDVTYYGRRHGRTGGIYIRNSGLIFNSVFWGNKCSANNDIQFASIRQQSAPTDSVFVYHSAFMNHDISDWTGVQKEMVFSLDKQNLPKEGSSLNFPCFFQPTVNPMNWNDHMSAPGLYGAGVFANLSPANIPGPRIWHLTSHSDLDQKGVQYSSAMVNPPVWLVHAHTEYGVVTNPYEPVSTLGALVRRPDKMRHAMHPQQGLEGRNDNATQIPTLFVDLNHEGHFDSEGSFITHDYFGDNWEEPLRSIGDALMYFRTYLKEEPNNSIGQRAYYRLPSDWDEAGNPTAYTDYDYVQLLVKEGEQSTAGPNNYLGKDMRTASIRTLSHMRLYGGYSKSLTGTDTGKRDPLNNPTIITANITKENGESAYQNNSAHVLTFVNAEYTIVDGFQLLNGNAHHLNGTQAVSAGGGVLVSNEITDITMRIDMVGNELRNCLLANNSAPKGAAIFVSGDNKKRQGFIMQLCYAELKVVNCIIRNNTADYSSGNNGVVTANCRAFIDIDHCDIVNNVGYPLQSDNTVWRTGAKEDQWHGYIRMDNSLLFCNGTSVLHDRSTLASNNVLSVDATGQDYVFGTYNMFDADITLHTADATQPHGFFKSDFVIPTVGGVLPTGMPDAANHPLNLAMPTEKYNQCIFTRDPNVATYPVFINPSRNIGHSVMGDRPLYGGKVSFIPLNNNPCVNAASVSAYGANNIPRPDAEDFDMTDSNRRNYGGEPDIGALEDTDLPVDGTVIYVTPDGAGKRDGSSWDNAIAGNTVYVLNNIDGPALADGDQIDSEITCDRVLDSVGNPRLTTDSLYSGGWGKVWMNTHTIYSTTHDATVHDHITYKSIYYGGDGDGEGREVVDSLRESREVLPDGENVPSVPEGFVPGTYDDPRYPYGEISGASRTFWRANPYTAGSYGNVNTFTNACNANGWINNTRAERYVGGLQYAVEKASAANKSYHRDSVQVWVGAGTYNDYKGFVMRDSVTVLGGFPATKYKAPGMAERQALMSNVINIPKSKPAEKLNAVDYESILQISDVNPKRDNTHLETNAVKYWDDDLDFVEHTTITGEVEADRVITRIYTWQTSDIIEDVTATYYQSSNFYDNQIQNEDSVGDFHSLDFGTATATKDCWHLTYTGNASTSGSNGVIGRYEDNQMSFKGHYQDIYENGQRVARTTDDGLAIRNGSLSGVKVWQTMKNVPAGYYRIVVDLNAYYRSASPANYNVPTGVNFIVLASDGDTLLNAPIHAKNKVGDRLQNNLARWQLNRYTFDSIIQPADGSLKVSIEIGEFDGSKGNNREALMENFKLIHVIPGNTYSQTDYSDERTQHPGSTGSSTSTYSATVTTHRTTLRKRVLTMPDVCVPTYGGGGIGDPVTMGQAFTNDALPHTDRVWGPTKDLRTAATLAKQEDPHYVEYNEASWDGFTIRHGFIYDEAMAHGGGAGVNIYEGAHLRNCIVINNVSACQRVKGAGMFCDGATSTIEGCFVLNNTSTQGTQIMQNQIFAGGMFMYEGTCFNSLFANNYSQGSAGGLGFCVGRFFNNTIAYNTATLVESSKTSGGAISLATSSNPNLFVANTIVFGNNGVAIRDRSAGYDKVNPFLYCYIQSEKTQSDATTTRNVINWSESATSNYGTGNTFLNGVAPSAANTPFAADFDEQGNYVAGRAASLNDFRLRDDVPCVNKGTEEFASEFYTALQHKGMSDSEIRNSFIYQSVEAAQLPDNDVAFAKRVQDCQIDMGAYEYNGAFGIKPDTITHPGKAIFYAAYVSPGGDASASSPFNAACAQKFQLILDAAGRYKYRLMNSSAVVKPVPVAGQPDKGWTVEVWLQGDNTNCTTSDHYADWYTPTRSTKHNEASLNDNPLNYSFIVPHGIYVKGGYAPGYFHYEDAAGNTVDAGTAGAHIVDDRDPLTYRSVLSGKITSNTGAEGNCYHVVTFTDDLFTELEEVKDDGGQLAFMSALQDAETHRAVLDGLFIEDGVANASDDEDRIGGGAVVAGFAHIRNCVVQNNEAEDRGGGLYLKPYALVSGTIIKKNTADVGGGVYIEAPQTHNVDSLAHVFTTTICHNNAHATAGGMWFDNTFARVNSTALWQNTANDYANVSGNFSRTSVNTDYPFNFCAVESRRIEGQGNIELSPRESEGVRWDTRDPFNDIMYYPIVMSSTLARAGVTYAEWRNTMNTYTTLDSIDIAGVSRMQWSVPGVKRRFGWGEDTLVVKSNDFIEIGARALNKTFEVDINSKYIMRRLYVIHTDLLNSDAAYALQNNPEVDPVSEMYRQLGSCIYNPFHRLGDALDYIVKVRRAHPDSLRNARFEIFLEKGTYYPYRDAQGAQGNVRSNTFLVPEAVTIVGGVNSSTGLNYGQEGFEDKYTNTIINTNHGENVPIGDTGYRVIYASDKTIRQCDDEHRKMRDYNLNSVIEPWEFDRMSVLSGMTVSQDTATNSYHVITIHADSTYVGPQPLKFKTDSSDVADWRKGNKLLQDPIRVDDEDNFYLECEASKYARAIILDGVQITGGYANNISQEAIAEHRYQTKTYFRGGGIFVDGNWTESFDDPAGEALPNVTDPAKYIIPLVVRNCQFMDNMAGNGGAIYSNGSLQIYNSHFVQNYSQGPMTQLDQQYMPWTAGGCIATNAYCGVVNCLFDNNEARRGLYPVNGDAVEQIPNADARQGFGGVLSVAGQALLRASNCHFVRNKAVAYPTIYNFLPNSSYNTADSMQLVFNSIFWGNEVFEVDDLGKLPYKVRPSDETIDTFNIKYKPSRKGVFHYDGDEWATYERLYEEYDSIFAYCVANNHIVGSLYDKLQELRAQGDKMEGMYFCSYRQGYGPSGMKPTSDGYLLTEGERNNFTDPRKMPVQIHSVGGQDMGEDYNHLFTQVHGNNNVLINRVNTASDGPNFKQPSPIAGIDGYMQNADWLLARMNHTTDQGWGHLKQSVNRAVYYTSNYTPDEHFETVNEALAAARAIEPAADSLDVVMHRSMPSATFEGVTEQDTTAMYNYIAKRAREYSFTWPRVPIGDDYYMTFTRAGAEGEEMSGEMRRISSNPRMGIEDVYIDIGMYEYQYIQLDLKGNEVDTMWVATRAKSDKQDGLTWETPTTDLQSAIDVLMSSRDNHDKYVCFLGDEESRFAPSNIIDNRRAFVITSNTLAWLLPDSAMADTDYGVNSLTFLGGYSYDVKDKPRDPAANPTIIEMPHAGNITQLNQLFVIEDVTRQKLQANWQGEYNSRDTIVIPITFDGITFINPYSTKDAEQDPYQTAGGVMSDRGGAAIYYRWQRQYEEQGSTGIFNPNFNIALWPDSTMIDGHKVEFPKLTISNCVFMDNGDPTVEPARRSSAVRIEHGGGSSLIVNSLFHSNAGEPIHADRHDSILGSENNLAAVPNDVTIVNSTSALNGGHITLLSDNNEVHNSLIWLDDLANDTLVQLRLHDDQWDKTTNKNKVGIADRVTYNAIWNCFLAGDDDYHNEPLSTNNMDIFEGPYFVDPNVNATTSEERRARSFRLNPAVRTMNTADTATYISRVFYRQYPDITEHLYWRRPNGFKADTITRLAMDYDLAYKPRLSGLGMERGAYECLAVLQRILYVNPTIPEATAGDGSSWQSPFGHGQIQNAIDVAAVYNYLNSKLDAESRRAYVFVKASAGVTDEEDIIARDGVTVLGSIPGNFNDTAFITTDALTEEEYYANEECQRFVNYVRSVTSGVASLDATPTYINSISTIAGRYPLGFSIESFIISNPNKVLTASPISIDNDSVTVRNCIIANNKVVGAPVIDLKKGLIYNSLIYRDSANAIINLGTNGLLLNNTIVNNYGDGVTNIANIDNTRVVNNLSCTASTANCFAPYLAQKNAYTLPDYLLQGEALNFQLHEHSTYINAGIDPPPAIFNQYISMGLVNFAVDRDVLGNPRRIGGQVDVGAFETWRIEPKTAVEVSALTNKIITQAEWNISTPEQKRNAFTSNNGGHKYPQRGSVVYLMDSAAMVMHDDPNDFVDFRNNNIILRPAYLLMKNGSSLFGNGHAIQLNYLAAEKKFVNQQYSMTAFPFNYNTDNITSTSYNSATDAITSHLAPISFNTYQYSGFARSAKDYVFQQEMSSSWLKVDTTNRSAVEGYLMDFGAAQDTVLRFNAFASALGEYIYTESIGELDRIVYLTQYDHRNAGTGSSLEFTRQEDMGWNMKGLPWLVSDYRTDTILEEGNYLRQMFIPHVFYQMDGTGEYITDGDNVYTSRSWDQGSTMSMGNAFLMQTATKDSLEAVIFHLPMYMRNADPARPIVRMTRNHRSYKPASDDLKPETGNLKQGTFSSDYLIAMPDSTIDKNVEYRYGRDGVKWMITNKEQIANSAAFYLLDSKRLARISLLGAAPTEMDIPVGVNIPREDEATTTSYTFSLPEKDAFADYQYVWFIDYEHNMYTNLLENDYTVDLPAGENNTRFALRIDGYPKVDKDGKRQYIVYAHGGILYVRGLVEGDRIDVYSPSGQHVYGTTAASTEFTMPLYDTTGFFIKVNDCSYKVVNL